MASGIRIELNHAGLEEVENSCAPLALAEAQKVQARANGMRSRKGIAEFGCGLRKGRRGGRQYAVVSADAPSNAADNARHNILAKAMG